MSEPKEGLTVLAKTERRGNRLTIIVETDNPICGLIAATDLIREDIVKGLSHPANGFTRSFLSQLSLDQLLEILRKMAGVVGDAEMQEIPPFC